MFVSDVMTKKVVTLMPEENLAQIVNKMIKFNFHTLPVVDRESRLLGIVDFKDIMKIFVPHNPALEKLLKSTHLYGMEEEDILETELPLDIGETMRVADIMNTHFVSTSEGETIADARRLMRRHRIERMPVERDGKLTGFVTLLDVIVALFRERKIIE
ncbi:MAG: CBS domain-containing protein [bacterium]|nr:CBS domain-containing protein [bacterium]